MVVFSVGAEGRDAGARPVTGVELRHQLALRVALPETHLLSK